jgi:hypothetical protein
MKVIEQSFEESNAYSLFVYAIRSEVTRDYYLRRLRIFFNYIDLQSNKTMEERCNYFASKATNDPNWAFNCIIGFLQYQKERVEKESAEINPRFDKLVTSLKTAVEKGEGDLDKEATSYDDLFDGYRLAMRYYQIKSNK